MTMYCFVKRSKRNGVGGDNDKLSYKGRIKRNSITAVHYAPSRIDTFFVKFSLVGPFHVVVVDTVRKRRPRDENNFNAVVSV